MEICTTQIDSDYDVDTLGVIFLTPCVATDVLRACARMQFVVVQYDDPSLLITQETVTKESLERYQGSDVAAGSSKRTFDYVGDACWCACATISIAVSSTLTGRYPGCRKSNITTTLLGDGGSTACTCTTPRSNQFP